uniref:Pentatricopeptide repeat-containing protein n=1 Tax=Oryza glaberrima TaxID=4538 RepID=I1R2I0_ORYGL
MRNAAAAAARRAAPPPLLPPVRLSRSPCYPHQVFLPLQPYPGHRPPALLTAYTNAGLPAAASRLFDEMPARDAVAWNARPGTAAYAFRGMATARFAPTAATLCTMALRPGCCVENSRSFMDAFLILGRIELNGIALTCALTACSATANLMYSMLVQCKAVRHGSTSQTILCNALIDMYAKCGRTMAARIVFDQMACRNVVSWSSMIDAYSCHGHGEAALGLFKRMEKVAPVVLPNEVTFLAVLSACGQSGLVDEGGAMLHLMKRQYGINPGPEHYACFIDLLGRAGQNDEAWYLYCSSITTRSELSGSICVAMLNACKANMDVLRGNKVALHLLEVDPENPGSHVLISNFHAVARQWSESDEPRRIILDKGSLGVQLIDFNSWY